jgi:hypothetical protein
MSTGVMSNRKFVNLDSWDDYNLSENNIEFSADINNRKCTAIIQPKIFLRLI